VTVTEFRYPMPAEAAETPSSVAKTNGSRIGSLYLRALNRSPMMSGTWRARTALTTVRRPTKTIVFV
jgi:hypothetical protein